MQKKEQILKEISFRLARGTANSHDVQFLIGIISSRNEEIKQLQKNIGTLKVEKRRLLCALLPFRNIAKAAMQKAAMQYENKPTTFDKYECYFANLEVAHNTYNELEE